MLTKRWALVAAGCLLLAGAATAAQQQPKSWEWESLPEKVKKREPSKLKGGRFITGEAAFEDGTPAEPSTPVELVCRGAVVARTVVDIRGQFTLVFSSQKSMGWFDTSIRYPLEGYNPAQPSGPSRSAPTSNAQNLSGCLVRVPAQAGVASNSLPTASA
jgi:hypothetical protein